MTVRQRQRIRLILRILMAWGAMCIASMAQDVTQLPLRPNYSIQGNVARTSGYAYAVRVRTGQYIRLSIKAIGVELNLALIDPRTGQTRRAWVPPDDIASYSIAADLDGDHILKLHSVDPNAPGQYVLQIEEVRNAIPRDKQLIEVEDLLRQGKYLNQEQKVESYRRAVDIFKRALELSRTLTQSRLEAEALTGIGESIFALSEFQNAITYYSEALAKWIAIGDPRDKCQLWDDIGRAYYGLSDLTQAKKYLNDSLELSRTISFTRCEAASLNDLGSVYTDLGDPKMALDYLQQSVALYDSITDHRLKGEALISIGVVYQNLGKQPDAMAALNCAVPLVHPYHDLAAEAIALNNLAASYSAIGEKQKALDTYNSALPIEREVGDRDGETYTLSNIGSIHEDLGDFKAAGEYYQQTLELAAKTKSRHDEMVAQVHLASLAEEAWEYQKALGMLRDSLAIAKAIPDPRWEAIILNNSAHIQYHLADREQKPNLYIEALDMYRSALSVERQIGNSSDEAITLSNVGNIQSILGHHTEAQQAYDAALADARLSGKPSAEATVLYDVARARYKQGDYAQASSVMQQAAALLESMRANVGTPDLRSSYFAKMRDFFDLYVDILMKLDAAYPGAGYAAQAFDQCERSRARTLLEMLNESGINLSEGVDKALIDKEASLNRQLADATQQEVKLMRSGESPKQLETVRGRIREFRIQRQTVEAEIRQSSPRYTDLARPQPLTAQQVQGELLDADTVLLEYVLGKDRSYLFTLTTSSLTASELPKRDDVEGLAHQLYDSLIARKRWIDGETSLQRKDRLAHAAREYERAAAALSQMLLGPIATYLEPKRLLIVPDGALQYIPFAILPVPINGQAKSTVPLIADHEIVSLPSSSVLALLRKQTSGRTEPRQEVAVLADPVFERDDPRVKIAALPTAAKRDSVKPAAFSLPYRVTRSLDDIGGNGRDVGSGLPRLVFSRQEANAIMTATSAGKAMEALDFQASRDTALSKDLGQYRIVHFATHGLLDNEHPELTGLVLSLVDQNGNPQDGFLSLQDIYKLDLPIDLVVLSACETGLGRQVRGEGLVGLTRGFMYAGVPRVVASLWKVDDVATADLMGHFYKAMLQRGMRPAAALREAQLEMWQDKRWSDPYYWAAFTIQGEWK